MDNNKNYKWSPEDTIEITGLEYDVLQKTVAIFEGAPAFSAASKVRIDILSRMVEKGIAKEYDPSKLQGEPEAEDDKSDEPVVNPS